MYLFGPDNAYIGPSSALGNHRNGLFHTCLLKCETGCDKLPQLRDNGYFEGKENDQYNSKCLLTGWEVSHFALHFFLGLFNFHILTSQSISVGFEIYERISYDCASYGDLIINLAGYLTGRAALLILK